MGQVDLPEVQPMGNKSTEEYVKYLANIVAILKDEIENILGGRLSSNNIREIAGYNVSETELKHKSGIVGMSGDDPQNPEAVRFWAGDAVKENAPYRVKQDGSWYSSNGTIEGGILRTNPDGQARIELSGNQLRTYNDNDNLEGMVLGPSDAGFSYGDVFFYYNGTKVMEFYNTLSDGYIIRPSGSANLKIGTSGKYVYPLGYWNFTNAVVSNIPQSAISDLISRLNDIESRLTALETAP